MQADEVFRLSELTRYVKQVLSINFESAFWVEAEINQISSSRGNFYIELVEKDKDSEEVLATFQARLWRSKQMIIRRKLGEEVGSFLQPGMQVKLRGKIDFHSVYGIAFHIEDIDKDFTLGEMERRKAETISRLTGEGLFDINKQLDLPPVIQKIAVISSRTAAGMADFINQLHNNQHQIPFSIHLYHASVQGINAVSDITGALNEISDWKDHYDAICILRGGGSKLDLSAFDEEKIARSIATMPLPVLTGIGHEIDLSVADMTAHTYLKTPTALAAFLIDRNATYLSELYQLYQNSLSVASGKLQSVNLRLSQLVKDSERVSYEQLQSQLRKMENIKQKIQFTTTAKLSEIKQTLKIQSLQAESADPAHVLERGFALVSQQNGIVKTLTELDNEKSMTLLFNDGRINVKPQ